MFFYKTKKGAKKAHPFDDKKHDLRKILTKRMISGDSNCYVWNYLILRHSGQHVKIANLTCRNDDFNVLS